MIALKREAEQGAWIERVPALIDRAFVRFDQALEYSTLLEQPAQPEATERWMIDFRIARQHSDR